MRLNAGKVLLIILIAICVIFLALFVVWPYYIINSAEVKLVNGMEGASAELLSFMEYSKNNSGNAVSGNLTYPNSTGISVYYYSDEKKQDIIYMWFDTEYSPSNLTVSPWININIEWEKGEPMEEPQLYYIKIKHGGLHNGIAIKYYEDGHSIYPRDYNMYIKSLENINPEDYE